MVQMGLFVPWEDFVHTEPEDVPALWQDIREGLGGRVKSYVENVGLLRKSAEDARQNAAMWRRITDGDDAIGVDYIPGVDEAEGGGLKETADDAQSLQALGQYLTPLGRYYSNPTGSCPVINVAQSLGETERAEYVGENIVPFSARSRTQLLRIQDNEGGPLRGREISKPQLKAVYGSLAMKDKAKKREIEGFVGEGGTTTDRGEVADQVLAGFGDEDIDEGDYNGRNRASTMEIQMAQGASYSALAQLCAQVWTLNRLQKMVVSMVAEFLDNYSRESAEQDDRANSSDALKQHLHYVGGEGGTGKSRIIEAIVDMFRRKGQRHHIVLTASSGAAAANIGGVTIHSALRLGGDDSRRGGNLEFSNSGVISEEEKWRWKDVRVLIVDEVTMVGGRTLQSINRALQARRENTLDFGGIPVVLLMGDFFQFGPVLQRSLLFSYGDLDAAAQRRQSPQSMLAHSQGRELWKKFEVVTMLQEQVRQRGDAEFHALLQKECVE